MKFELSREAEKDLDAQRDRSDESDDDKDPVEQTVEVPKGGTQDDAVEAVQKQYEEKSGLQLDADVTRTLVQDARDEKPAETDD